MQHFEFEEQSTLIKWESEQLTVPASSFLSTLFHTKPMYRIEAMNHAVRQVSIFGAVRLVCG